MDLIADTSFLVGLWRGQDWAKRYAVEHCGQSLGLPWVVLGEFWHGAMRAQHDEAKVREFLSIGIPIYDAAPVVSVYAQMCASMQGEPSWLEIAQNDLWIAATALACAKPLVTRNHRHFDRIQGLRLEVLER